MQISGFNQTQLSGNWDVMHLQTSKELKKTSYVQTTSNATYILADTIRSKPLFMKAISKSSNKKQ